MTNLQEKQWCQVLVHGAHDDFECCMSLPCYIHQPQPSEVNPRLRTCPLCKTFQGYGDTYNQHVRECARPPCHCGQPDCKNCGDEAKPTEQREWKFVGILAQYDKDRNALKAVDSICYFLDRAVAEARREAFLDGFCVSTEGYNGDTLSTQPCKERSAETREAIAGILEEDGVLAPLKKSSNE